MYSYAGALSPWGGYSVVKLPGPGSSPFSGLLCTLSIPVPNSSPYIPLLCDPRHSTSLGHPLCIWKESTSYPNTRGTASIEHTVDGLNFWSCTDKIKWTVPPEHPGHTLSSMFGSSQVHCHTDQWSICMKVFNFLQMQRLSNRSLQSKEKVNRGTRNTALVLVSACLLKGCRGPGAEESAPERLLHQLTPQTLATVGPKMD